MISISLLLLHLYLTIIYYICNIYLPKPNTLHALLQCYIYVAFSIIDYYWIEVHKNWIASLFRFLNIVSMITYRVSIIDIKPCLHFTREPSKIPHLLWLSIRLHTCKYWRLLREAHHIDICCVVCLYFFSFKACIFISQVWAGLVFFT